MKTWLKGGLIGIIVSVILIVMSIVIKINLAIPFRNSLIPNLVKQFSSCGGDQCIGAYVFWGILCSLIFYFIIGAIIGLIIQKIKSK